MKSKKLVIGLSITAAVLFLVLLLTIGLVWFRTNHVFVEGQAYPLKAQSLDLSAEEISFDHYDSLQSQLPDCYILWNVPFQGSRYSSESTSLTITDLTDEDIAILQKYFPNLGEIDAMGCSNYEMLEKLKAAMEGLTVHYEVSLGETAVSPDTDALVLSPADYDFDVLQENLKYLPNVTSIQLKTPDVPMEKVEALQEAHPEITISCTVEILGKEYDTKTERLDLSALTSEQVAETAEKLKALTGLKAIELNNTEGKSQLSLEEAKLIVDAAPEAAIHYTFDFFGVSVTTTDEEVIVKGKKIGDEGEPQIRAALDLMGSNCRRFVLDN